MQPPGQHRAVVARVLQEPPEPPGRSGTFTSDFAREMMSGAGWEGTGTPFKSDFASLVHSSFSREEVTVNKFYNVTILQCYNVLQRLTA
jgi:hypothetical protein